MIKLGQAVTMPQTVPVPQVVWTIDAYGDGRGQLRKPLALCTLCDDVIAVADIFNYRVQVFESNGKSHSVLGQGKISPRGIASTRHGNVAVVDSENKVVNVYDPHTDKCLRSFGQGKFEYPCGIACTLGDDFYVTDIQTHTVSSFSSDGRLLHRFQYSDPYSPRGPSFIAADQRGRLLVSDTLESTIHAFDLDGNLLKRIGGQGSAQGCFNQQHGITLDKDDNIIVADTGNNRVCLLNPEGNFLLDLLTLESDLIHDPRGVTLDSCGHMTIALYDDSKLVKYKMFEC